VVTGAEDSSLLAPISGLEDEGGKLVGSRIHPSGDAGSAAGAGRYPLSELSAWSID
jgi:hypothetical protein